MGIEEVQMPDLPARIRALIRVRGIRPAVLLGILANYIQAAGGSSFRTPDRTFDGCRDALYAMALAWNRVLRPMVVPRSRPEPIPAAFGGEGATMDVLGTPVTVYYPAIGGEARLRAVGEDVALPRHLHAALGVLAVAVGSRVTSSCDCGVMRG